MFLVMPSQMKGTHVFHTSNSSIGAAHTQWIRPLLVNTVGKHARSLHCPCTPLEGRQTLRPIFPIMIAPCPIHSHHLFIILYPCTHLLIHPTPTNINTQPLMIWSLPQVVPKKVVAVTKPSGLVLLSTVAAELGHFQIWEGDDPTSLPRRAKKEQENDRRDKITRNMWDQYQNELQIRGVM